MRYLKTNSSGKPMGSLVLKHWNPVRTGAVEEGLPERSWSCTYGRSESLLETWPKKGLGKKIPYLSLFPTFSHTTGASQWKPVGKGFWVMQCLGTGLLQQTEWSQGWKMGEGAKPSRR